MIVCYFDNTVGKSEKSLDKADMNYTMHLSVRESAWT